MRGWTPFMIQSVPLVVGGRSILFIGMILRVFWTFYKHLRLPTRGTWLKPCDQAVFNNQRPTGPTGCPNPPTFERRETPRPHAPWVRQEEQTRPWTVPLSLGVFGNGEGVPSSRQLASRTPEMDVGKSVFFFQMQVSVHAGLLGGIQLGRIVKQCPLFCNEWCWITHWGALKSIGTLHKSSPQFL